MEEYTPKQLEVINVNHGYNMVLAGPGCGKTRILAERVAKAYERDGRDLSDLLCLTFTNRAAREMFNKIRTRLGKDNTDLFVGNIHRYCSHFLFEEGVVAAETSVMDEEDTTEVLNSEVSEQDIKMLIEYKEVSLRYGIFVNLNWNIVNGLLNINIRPSGSSGLVKLSKAKSIISQVRLRVMEMQHLIFQIRNEHPQSDWYHKEIVNIPIFNECYESLSKFI